MAPRVPRHDSHIDLVTRVAVLERQMDGYPPREWVKDFVSDNIKPIIETISRIEQVNKSLSEQAEELFVEHKKALQDRAQREQEEHSAKLKEMEDLARSRTWQERIKRNAPTVTLIGGIFAILVLLKSVADKVIPWLLQHYSASPGP